MYHVTFVLKNLNHFKKANYICNKGKTCQALLKGEYFPLFMNFQVLSENIEHSTSSR